MKKTQWIAGAMAMIMGGMALTAYAEDMTVEFTQESTYKISIPMVTVNANAGEATTVTLSFSDINITPTQEINVSITSGLEEGGVVTLAAQDGQENDVTVTAYTDSGDPTSSTIDPADIIFTADSDNIEDGSATGTFYLSDINETDPEAGTYQGTITYTIAVEEAGE